MHVKGLFEISPIPMCMYVFTVSTEAKERVLKKGTHQMEVDNKPVTIILESVENFLAQPREGAKSDEKHPNKKHIPVAEECCVQKVSIDRSGWCVPATFSPVTIPFIIRPMTICQEEARFSNYFEGRSRCYTLGK